jgi:hypothetical protein
MNMERSFEHLVWFCPKGENGYYLVCGLFHEGIFSQLMQQLGYLKEIPLSAKNEKGEEEMWFGQNHYMHH